MATTVGLTDPRARSRTLSALTALAWAWAALLALPRFVQLGWASAAGADPFGTDRSYPALFFLQRWLEEPLALAAGVVLAVALLVVRRASHDRLTRGLTCFAALELGVSAAGFAGLNLLMWDGNGTPAWRYFIAAVHVNSYIYVAAQIAAMVAIGRLAAHDGARKAAGPLWAFVAVVVGYRALLEVPAVLRLWGDHVLAWAALRFVCEGTGAALFLWQIDRARETLRRVIPARPRDPAARPAWAEAAVGVDRYRRSLVAMVVFLVAGVALMVLLVVGRAFAVITPIALALVIGIFLFAARIIASLNHFALLPEESGARPAAVLAARWFTGSVVGLGLMLGVAVIQRLASPAAATDELPVLVPSLQVLAEVSGLVGLVILIGAFRQAARAVGAAHLVARARAVLVLLSLGTLTSVELRATMLTVVREGGTTAVLLSGVLVLGLGVAGFVLYIQFLSELACALGDAGAPAPGGSMLSSPAVARSEI
jgi:hypothetical protein